MNDRDAAQENLIFTDLLLAPRKLIAERIRDIVEMVNNTYGHLYLGRHKQVADKLDQLIVPMGQPHKSESPIFQCFAELLKKHIWTLISEIATNTASPLMAIRPSPSSSQCRYPPRFDAWYTSITDFPKTLAQYAAI